MLTRLFYILLGFFLLLILANCAKIGSPVGGPRDETPPVIESSDPLNRSVNFKGKQIEITFDEYIRTDAMRQELVVSPPFEERPEFRMRKKTLIIEWEEDLADSTTYTFSFGEAIKDLNEGNILRNFEFVFSTGSYIDSLAVIGTVVKAENLMPHSERVFMMLYENHDDSAPLLEVPNFLGVADDNGNFLINNVRPGSYRLFALQDQNRNYKYDVPEESIGFLDSAIYLNPSLFITASVDSSDSVGGLPNDSVPGLLLDSLLAQSPEPAELIPGSDSIILAGQDTVDFSMADSLILEEDDSLTLADLAPWSVFVEVFLFEENNTPQYLIDNSRKDPRTLTMRFNRKVEDTVIIEPYNFEAERDWYIYEEHVMRDTFVYWITDSLIYKNDSLEFLVTYHVTDSLMNFIPFYDTLKFNYRKPATKTGRQRKKDQETEPEKETISITQIRTGGSAQDLHVPLSFEIKHPVSEIDTTRISLVRIQDSLEYPVSYSLKPDKRKLRKYHMNVAWEGITSYKLVFYPEAFRDIYGLTNDTVTMQFATRDPEYYGRILLNLSGIEGPTVVQVLSGKGMPVRQRRVSTDGLIEFDFMAPESFTLKLIDDRNDNGEWDTGDYLQGLQPEGVTYHPGTINIRSNFDLEVNWDIRDQEPDPDSR